MHSPNARVRIATHEDERALDDLIQRSSRALLPAFLDPEEIEASLEAMTLDRLLIRDGTYFIAEAAGVPVACGGWSRRRAYVTTPGAMQQPNEFLDPAAESARIRAMYTHPDHVRRGLGRLILRTCERAARDAGFADGELFATLAGEPLYLAEGWRELERTTVRTGSGVVIPAVRMAKRLATAAAQPG